MKKSGLESPPQVQETRSAFHPHAQRNAFRRRGVRPQSRSFALENPRLNRNRAGSRLLFFAEFLESGIDAQRVPNWIQPKKGRRDGRWVIKPATIRRL